MFKINNILCPIDFSEASRKAMRYAQEFATGMGAKLWLLNVVEPRPMAVDISLNYVPLEEDLEKAASEDLDDLLKELERAGVEAEGSVRIGNPADVILDQVKELGITMVIMGSHGKKGLSRLLMGSVAETVVRKVACPVLIVKEGPQGFIGEE